METRYSVQRGATGTVLATRFRCCRSNARPTNIRPPCSSSKPKPGLVFAPVDAIISLPGLHQPLSSVSHLTGAIVFAWLSIYLLRPLWRDWGRFASVAIFALAAISLLSISSTYHMFAHDEYAGAFLLRLDLAAIFVLIAGSFTPVHAILFAGWKRWGILALIWSIAVAGILVRMIFFESIKRPSGSVIFLAMGWIGGYTSFQFFRRGDWYFLVMAIAGGLLYSVGAITNAVGWPTLIPGIWGPHETMHFAVLGGLACHWALISRAVDQSQLPDIVPINASYSDARPPIHHEQDDREKKAG